MSIYDRLITVFDDTRKLSLGKFNTFTTNAIKNTEVVVDGSVFLSNVSKVAQEVSFNYSGSVKAALDLAGHGKVAVLNFADAYCPGGLVLAGAITQEEGICRSSNLYETLIQPKCMRDYYEYNSSLVDDVKQWASDRLIYSKDVLLFKDEEYNLLDTPVKVDIITSPAPIECDDISVFERRIKCIVGSAYLNGVDVLVLGKWGCGAFRNSAKLVSRAFKTVLDEYKLFKMVVFALYDLSPGTLLFENTLTSHVELSWL